MVGSSFGDIQPSQFEPTLFWPKEAQKWSKIHGLTAVVGQKVWLSMVDGRIWSWDIYPAILNQFEIKITPNFGPVDRSNRFFCHLRSCWTIFGSPSAKICMTQISKLIQNDWIVCRKIQASTTPNQPFWPTRVV